MDIPSEKQEPSPITGRSSREAEPVSLAETAPERPPPPDENDIHIGDEIFETPVISLPPRSIRNKIPGGTLKSPGSASTEPTPPPQIVKAVATRKKQPLERRTDGAQVRYKRTIRPATNLAAHTAMDNARAESAVSTDKVSRDAMEFGKIHERATPDYRPNRLFTVLDDAHKHSKLRWLDVFDRVSFRFLFYFVIALTLVGFALVRYFGSLGERDRDPFGSAVTVLSTSERIERGKKTAQNFLSARTIEARLPLVLDPDRAGPRMKHFYGSMGGQDPGVVSWEVGAPINGDQGTWLPFIFQDSGGRKVTVVIGETESGCRMDWENFAAFGEMTWPDFCRTRPSAPKAMRVRIRLSDRYEGIYTKEAWQAYEVEHRSGGAALRGYASRTGRSAQELGELVKGGQWKAAQAYLRFDSTAGGDNLIVIDGIVSNRWQDTATSWSGP